ncbi:MAG: glycoside hydrolase family 43 protein [[Clostridium] fimetarium]|nr:glycoside hydrolase family 43 protein [Alistipes timonensis]MCM1406100.1 glycoside hydrolase family 43 protein [[Clostridium] fimetarium]
MNHFRDLLSAALLAACCASASAGDPLFSHFTYNGDDDYCREELKAPGEYYNPVISGWASDPSITRKGDDYWLVTSTFGYFPGVPVYHSRDLVSWEHAANALSRPSQLPWLEGLSLDKGGIYAPAITYNRHNDLFYLITTCVTKGKGVDEGSINFYVTAKDPAGEWSDPVVLPGVTGIDPSFFFDDDGSGYIVYKSDEHSPVKWSNNRALSIIRFDAATGQTVGDPVKFREKGVGPEERLERDEGPHIFKARGKYYLIAAEGGTGINHSEVVYKADSVMGPYERWGRNPMLTQRLLKPNRSNPVTSTGHVDVVETPAGDWYAVFLGCRPWNGGEDQLGRETFLMPVEWSADSFPRVIHNFKDTVPLRAEVKGAAASQRPGQAGNFGWTDRFAGRALAPRWMSLHGPADKFYAVNDGLTLKCAPVDTRSSSTPAYLGSRIQHHKFSAETELAFTPEGDESAGLLIVKNETRQYYLAVRAGEVALLSLGKGNATVLASAPVATTASAPIGLRAVSRGSVYDFYYRPGNEAEWRLLAADIPAAHTATQRGGFTGSTIGLAATSVKL